MGAMSRNKGKVGEREIASLVADLTGWDVKRKVRQLDGESDLEGVPGWSVEVKRHASATRGSVSEWWGQACRQAEKTGERPVLFYRKDRDEWRAVWGLSAWPMWEEGPCVYAMSVEGSVDAWAAVAREIDQSVVIEIRPDTGAGDGCKGDWCGA